MNDRNVPAAPSNNLPDAAGRMQDLLGGLANVANSIAEAGGVASAFPFIGINGDGIWSYGQERTEVEEGSEWGIDCRTMQHGYIAWPDQKSKDRKPLGERMVPANSPLPLLQSLPDVGQPYQLQFAFELLCMSGEDAGTMALYKNGSYGAKVIVQNLVEELRKQAKTDPSRLCPIVVLEIRSYFHNEWKKTIYNPVLQIQRWVSFDEYDGFEKTNAPQTAQVAAPEPEPEPEPVAAAPAPRRRAAAQAAAAKAPEPAPAPAGRRRPSSRTQPSA